jgi:hypothetical protein
MQQIFKYIPGFMFMIMAAACNANSDAVRVLETENTSLRATVAAYQSVGPTMTAQATLASQRLATLQTDLTTARAQVRDLTAKLNTGGGQPQLQPTLIAGANNPAAQDPITPGAPGTQQATYNGFAFAEVVTAKSIDDATGCASAKSSTFSVNDNRIFVVADVRNLKGGTSFKASWAGTDFTRENSWTAKRDSAQLCIYFYIEPKTLALKPGEYTVTFGAPNLSATPVQFTVQ